MGAHADKRERWRAEFFKDHPKLAVHSGAAEELFNTLWTVTNAPNGMEYLTRLVKQLKKEDDNRVQVKRSGDSPPKDPLRVVEGGVSVEPNYPWPATVQAVPAEEETKVNVEFSPLPADLGTCAAP